MPILMAINPVHGWPIARLFMSALVLVAASSLPAAAQLDPAPSSASPAPSLPSIAPGLKQELEDIGIKLDLYLTGSLQSQAAGSDASAAINALTDRGTGTGSYGSGRFDVLLQLDSTRLGLWRGTQLNAHLEAEEGALPGWRGGAFWPVSTSAILPLSRPNEWSLTSLYLRQKWGGTRLMIGKVNVIDLYSQNPFFGGWGIERFQNLALVLPPTGVTPVSMMAASISQEIGDVTLTAMAYDPNDRTMNTFARLFSDGVNISVSAQWNGLLWQRSSNFGLAVIGTTQKSVSLKETFLPSELRQRASLSPSNLTLNFGHQIWPSPVRGKKGVGVYGRIGFTGGDPNPIQSSVAVGISGDGMWVSRPWDGFGIGYYRYNWSNGLSETLLTSLQSESGLEMYYNFALSPWLYITPNLQLVYPATAGQPLLSVVGLRSVLRF